MPETAKAFHNGRIITFTEADHSYKDDAGQVYTSTTTFLKQFFQEFDADDNARRMEAQGKGNAEDLLAEWDRKREDACRYGTRVHEMAEDAILLRPGRHQPESEKEENAFPVVQNFARRIFDRATIVGCEMLVFCPRFGISGCIDLVIRTHAGKIIVLDWKSNEKIDMQGFRNRHAKSPISHMQDCDFTKYALQLNTYSRILLEESYIPEGSEIAHALLYVNPLTWKIDYIPVPTLHLETANCILRQIAG